MIVDTWTSAAAGLLEKTQPTPLVRSPGRLGTGPQQATATTRADRDIVHEILYAAILYHLAARPDTGSAQEIAEHLTAVLRQTGYRTEDGNPRKMHS
jgi:hypothetical protein